LFPLRIRQNLRIEEKKLSHFVIILSHSADRLPAAVGMAACLAFGWTYLVVFVLRASNLFRLPGSQSGVL
jgi:hypothetical protein